MSIFFKLVTYQHNLRRLVHNDSRQACRRHMKNLPSAKGVIPAPKDEDFPYATHSTASY
ncbi:MAG: hypothetical protein KME57_04050 [Scytonema hyalinum WJT4-NPBG1]|nr:hypothetical protein [Scytonema hyalinum WJT4-NPBG1]